MLLIWAFAFGFIKKKISEIEGEDTRRLDVSDFSVVIENVPTDFSVEEIQKQFKEYLTKMKN